MTVAAVAEGLLRPHHVERVRRVRDVLEGPGDDLDEPIQALGRVGPAVPLVLRFANVQRHHPATETPGQVAGGPRSRSRGPAPCAPDRDGRPPSRPPARPSGERPPPPTPSRGRRRWYGCPRLPTPGRKRRQHHPSRSTGPPPPRPSPRSLGPYRSTAEPVRLSEYIPVPEAGRWPGPPRTSAIPNRPPPCREIARVKSPAPEGRRRPLPPPRPPLSLMFMAVDAETATAAQTRWTTALVRRVRWPWGAGRYEGAQAVQRLANPRRGCRGGSGARVLRGGTAGRGRGRNYTRARP